MNTPRGRLSGSLRADILPFLLVALLVAAASATTVIGPQRLRALADQALRQTVAAASYDDRSLTLQAELTGGRSGENGAEAAQPGSLRKTADGLAADLSEDLRRDFPTAGHTYLARDVPADGGGVAEPGGLPAALTLSDDDRTARAVVYRQGAAPDAPHPELPDGTVAVALSTQASRTLDLPLGAAFRLGPMPKNGGPATRAVVTGVFDAAPRTTLSRDDAAFLAASQNLFTPKVNVLSDDDPRRYWTAYVVVADLGLENLLAQQPDAAVYATWRQTADPARLDAGQIKTLRHQLATFPVGLEDVCEVVGLPYDEIPNCHSMRVLTPSVRAAERMTPIFDRFAADRLSAAALESFGIAGLLAVELAAVLAAARLVAARKAGTVALSRARGASVRQTALALGLESGLVIAPVAVLGRWAGHALGGPGSGTVDGGGQVWPAVLVAALGVAAVPALALWSGAPGRGPARGGIRVLSKARRRTVEVLVLGLAVAGVLGLRARGTAGTVATGSVDPEIALVPVLVGAVGVLAVVKMLPRPVAAVARLAGRTRGAAGWLGVARAADRGQTAAMALGVLVVTLSGAVFGGVVLRTLSDGQQQAAGRLGADAVVRAPDLTPAAMTALRNAHGVASVSGELAIPRIAVDDSDGTGHPIVLVGVDPGLLPGVPAADPAGNRPVPVLGSPGLVKALPGKAFTTDLNSDTHEFEVTATLPGPADDSAVPEVLRPAFRDYTAPFAVLPMAELSRLSGGRDAGLAVLTGGAITGDGLRSALSVTTVGGADIEVRTEDLARMRSDGLARSLTGVFAVCSALSAGFAVLIVVLDLAAGARERGRAVSVLRTMGLPSRAAATLTAVQLVPTLVAAAAAGTVLGLALPRLLGPALDLTAFTDGYNAPTRTDMRLTLLLGAALIGVGALAAGLEAVLGRRRRISGVLRLGDE